MFIKRWIKDVLAKFGFFIVRIDPASSHAQKFEPDFDPEAIEIIQKVRPYTMTSNERIFALIEATRYIMRANIAGSIVECGVWRGGSMMAVAEVLMRANSPEQDLYLFDTYEGMTRPSERDISHSGLLATHEFERTKRSADSSSWCYASLDEVQHNLKLTNYPANKLHFIKGKVEDTIPAQAPQEIALLRLDTDWYESTRHELTHLFPRLSQGGVLIIDDYGDWMGCKKAVDEYMLLQSNRLFLHRIDRTGRLAIKYLS